MGTKTKTKTNKPPVRPKGSPKVPGSGSKRKIPTEAEEKVVSKLSGLGLRLEDIAALTDGGITVQTLRTRYPLVLRSGKAKANSVMANCLFTKAKKGCVSSIIFWLKTQAGFKIDRDEPLDIDTVVPLIVKTMRAMDKSK